MCFNSTHCIIETHTHTNVNATEDHINQIDKLNWYRCLLFWDKTCVRCRNTPSKTSDYPVHRWRWGAFQLVILKTSWLTPSHPPYKTASIMQIVQCLWVFNRPKYYPKLSDTPINKQKPSNHLIIILLMVPLIGSGRTESWVCLELRIHMHSYHVPSTLSLLVIPTRQVWRNPVYPNYTKWTPWPEYIIIKYIL